MLCVALLVFERFGREGALGGMKVALRTPKLKHTAENPCNSIVPRTVVTSEMQNPHRDVPPDLHSAFVMHSGDTLAFVFNAGNTIPANQNSIA
jgi:hypothetical protein